MAVLDKSFGGYRIFVGDLGRTVSKHALRRVYEYYGPLLDIWLARNPPGFAFLVFKRREDADKAVTRTHGRSVCGRIVRVEHARPFEPKGKPSHVYSARSSMHSRSRSRSRDRTKSKYRSKKRTRSESRSPSSSRSKKRRSKEGSKERSTERSRERSRERSKERSRERSKEKLNGKSDDQSKEPPKDVSGDTPKEQPKGEANSQPESPKDKSQETQNELKSANAKENEKCDQDMQTTMTKKIHENGNGDHRPIEKAKEERRKSAERVSSKFQREPKEGNESEESNDEL